jgi:hypothetical protein
MRTDATVAPRAPILPLPFAARAALDALQKI